ncbi:hypothetical protein AOQ71_26050 [Bradyrhizobium manausense]|uniref:Uncharacterized protein n=1 Tax=Bradyrhizobium manausense TaxID=989370 RepID=A0A0R3DDR5_9BRAD|nr:hypothetical protein AOQ71_26050 [Bradyrhizobium manausense]
MFDGKKSNRLALTWNSARTVELVDADRKLLAVEAARHRSDKWAARSTSAYSSEFVRIDVDLKPGGIA